MTIQEKAIEQLERISSSLSAIGEKEDYTDIAIQALEQTRWIPVSERLPEKHDCYLVTTKWKGSYSGDIYTETNMAVYREKLEEWDSVGVIAWMPLPEPYEGGGAIANEN